VIGLARPSRGDRRRAAVVGLVVLVASVMAGCATAPAPRDPLLRAQVAAQAGDREAYLRLVRDIVRDGPAAGSIPSAVEAATRAHGAEAALWRGVLAELEGHDEEAAGSLVLALSDPGAPGPIAAAAAARFAAMVDRVALPDTRVHALVQAMAREGLPGVVAAEAVALVAVRREARDLLEGARRRLGAVESHCLEGPRDRRPVSGRPAPRAPRAFGEEGSALARPEGRLAGERAPAAPGPCEGGVRAAPGGAIALPPGGVGVYGVIVPLPDLDDLEVEIVGAPAVRAYLAGRLVAESPRLSALRPERLTFDLRPEGVEALELHLADRGFSRPVEVRVRPAVAPEGVAPLAPITGAVVGLALARRSRDVEAAVAHLRAFAPASPVGEVLRAELAAWDTTRPGATLRAERRRLLERALAAAPTLGAARAALATQLLDEGDATRGAHVARGGPLGDHRDRIARDLAHAAGRAEEAEAAAERHRARLPWSCEAWDGWLGLAWERLRLAPALPDPIPGCGELRRRVARLLEEAWRLERADALLEALAPDAAAGAEQARIALDRARLALRAGEVARARALAELALAEGGEEELALETLLRVARLEGDDALLRRVARQVEETPGVSGMTRRQVLDLERDLGLPLDEAVASLRAARSASAGAREGEAEGSYEVVLHDRRTRIYPDGAMLHRVHRIVSLTDAHAAEEFGEIAVPEDAEVLVARTWRPLGGGRFEPIEPEDFVEKTSISLPALERGALAEVAWFWFDAPAARLGPGWETPLVRLESERGRTHRARLTLLSPADQPMELVLDGDPGALEVTPRGPGVLEVHATARPRVLLEPLDPSPERRLASVRAASGLDPAAIVDHLRDHAATATRVTPSVRDAVDAALADVAADADDEARLRALHRYVTGEIRDANERLEITSASATAAARRGERAVLLTAMVRAAGLAGELVLVRPLSVGGSDPRRFEHEAYVYPVVRARLGERTVWLETASRFAPFDYLPSLLQGAEALALGPRPERLITPRTPAGEGERALRVTIEVGADGAWVARGEDVVTGVFAASWRQALAGMTPDARRRGLEGLALEAIPGADVESVAVEGGDDVEGALTVRWQARGHSPGGAEVALTLGVGPDGLGRSTVLLAERETPMLVNRLSRMSVEIVVEAPDGWSFARVPGEVRVRHPLLEVTRWSSLSPDRARLTIHKTARVDAGIVLPDDYAAWKDAAYGADQADVAYVIVAPGAGER